MSGVTTMSLHVSALSLPVDENTQTSLPRHRSSVEKSLARKIAVAPGKQAAIIEDSEPAAGLASAERCERHNELERRRKLRVEEIIQSTEHSHSRGGGGTGRGDSLVAALDMKPRRSFCYKQDGQESSISYGEDDDEVTPVRSLSRSMPSHSPSEPCHPSRASILKKADSEPMLKTTSTPASVTDPEALQRRNELRRQVTFHSVTIREYPMTIGDHPNCSYGPPVSLSWDYDEYEPVGLNHFESRRPQRRNLGEMMMNYYRRKNVLKHWGGHSEEELNVASKNTSRIKRQRSITSFFMPVFVLQEVTVGAMWKVKKAVRKKVRKKDSQSKST